MLAGAAAEAALYRLEASQHLGRIEIAFDQRDGVGEIPPGAAVRGVEHDGGSVEQPELLVEPRDRCFDHARGTTETAVPTVRPNRDCVELGHAFPCHCDPCEGKGKRSSLAPLDCFVTSLLAM